MARWTIDTDRVRRVDPSSGRDTEAAFAFYLQSNGAERQMTVEYVRGVDGSVVDATANVRPYLDEDIPPRRLIVDRQGGVSAWVD